MRLNSVFVRVLPLAFCCGASSAATEFTTTVPEDLLREFTGGTALRDLPEGFPSFVMPEGVQLIGSDEAPHQQMAALAMPEGILLVGSPQAPIEQMVLLRTYHGGAESQRAVANALMASGGWIELVSPGAAQNGFVVPAQTRGPITLCHNDHGMFEIRGEGEDRVENRVYIRRFAMANVTQGPTCARQNESRVTGRPPDGQERSSITRYRPSLEALILPLEPSAADASSGHDDNLIPLNTPQLGIRGVPTIQTDNSIYFRSFPTSRWNIISGRYSAGVDSRLLVAVGDRSLRTIRLQIADLMEAQGWQLDSEWTSTDTAASHWLRVGDEDKGLLFRLHISRTPDDYFLVTSELVGLGN